MENLHYFHFQLGEKKEVKNVTFRWLEWFQWGKKEEENNLVSFKYILQKTKITVQKDVK